MSETDAAPKKAGGRNLPVAIATGFALVGLIFGTLYTSRLAWDLVVGSVVTFGCYEFFSTVRAAGYEPATALGLAACAAMMGGAAWRGPRAITFVLTVLVLATFVWFLADSSRKNTLANVAVTITGACYTGLLGAHVIMMRDLPSGPGVTIVFIGAVVFYDIGAFAAGSTFGKHKIAPAVSPGKTWEGAIGATVLVLLLGAAAGPFIGHWTLASSLAIAAATSVVAPFGDLAESLLKRDLGVKDFGNLLPGHGGMLDRIDALLLMAPVAYWLARGMGV